VRCPGVLHVIGIGECPEWSAVPVGQDVYGRLISSLLLSARQGASGQLVLLLRLSRREAPVPSSKGLVLDLILVFYLIVLLFPGLSGVCFYFATAPASLLVLSTACRFYVPHFLNTFLSSCLDPFFPSSFFRASSFSWRSTPPPPPCRLLTLPVLFRAGFPFKVRGFRVQAQIVHLPPGRSIPRVFFALSPRLSLVFAWRLENLWSQS